MNRKDSDPTSRRQWLANLAGKRTPTRIGPTGEAFHADAEMFDQPVNDSPDQLAPLDLPPISDATLSRQDVVALFRDLESFATNIELTQPLRQRRAGSQTANAPATLTGLRDRLLDPNAPSTVKVQIRYTWQGQRWIDTIERRGPDYRLVRIAHPAS